MVQPGAESEWRGIRAGVPKDSILGPLIFLLFINDILVDIGSSIRLFADDTSLVIVVEKPLATAQILNIDQNKIMNWGNKWLVRFNGVKAEAFLASRKLIKPVHPSLFMDDTQLVEVDSHKQLGVIFAHVTNILNISKTKLGRLSTQ